VSKIRAADLSISAVAARTGVAAATLRAWELRFGFPSPGRLEGGHRRYSEDDVARIEAVLRERERGRSLERAIELAARPDRIDGSLFAGLRRSRPDLPVQVLSRRSMLAISRAIEDECCAQADDALLIAAFQREDVYRRAQTRWDDLARTARGRVVFAEFERSRITRAGAREVAVPARSPLVREWAVICDAPGSAACLAGWERTDGRGFEALWSVDPDVVRHAVWLGLELARHHAPRLDLKGLAASEEGSADLALALRRAEAIANRVVAYLDR
jgi:DICT domain-containing protein